MMLIFKKKADGQQDIGKKNKKQKQERALIETVLSHMNKYR